MLLERVAAGRPVTVGLIGAGKFGTMFLTQVRTTVGMHVVAVADLNVPRARTQLASAGWSADQYGAASLDDALASRGTVVTDDAEQLFQYDMIEVIIEATGDPAVGIRHALKTAAHGKHIVMVNVEADAVAGPLLAERAREAGVIYSLAWGDQPALICEHVDWARTCGFRVVAAGKGTRYHPSYHRSTPDTVFDILDKYLRIDDRGSINPKMFNSFIDGSKSAIEMTAVCNATGLQSQTDGLSFPPASRYELADVCKPRVAGGVLERNGVTEVVSSVDREERDVLNNLVMGTYVVVEAETPYAQQCIREYNCLPDASGRYAALYRPTHMIGLELGISVASVALRREPTGAPVAFNSDVVATAKRDLKAGEILDGEGGFACGENRPQRSCRCSLDICRSVCHIRFGSKPISRKGGACGGATSSMMPEDFAIKIRREMESRFGEASASAQ